MFFFGFANVQTIESCFFSSDGFSLNFTVCCFHSNKFSPQAVHQFGRRSTTKAQPNQNRQCLYSCPSTYGRKNTTWTTYTLTVLRTSSQESYQTFIVESGHINPWTIYYYFHVMQFQFIISFRETFIPTYTTRGSSCTQKSLKTTFDPNIFTKLRRFYISLKGTA